MRIKLFFSEFLHVGLEGFYLSPCSYTSDKQYIAFSGIPTCWMSSNYYKSILVVYAGLQSTAQSNATVIQHPTKQLAQFNNHFERIMNSCFRLYT